MTVPSRRSFVAGTLTAGAAVGLAAAGIVPAHAEESPAPAPHPTPGGGGAVVTPGDPRYAALSTRGSNKRFTAQPDAFRLVTTTEEAVRAVGDAVRTGRRIAVRSGAHCYENVAGDPAVRLVLDLGAMDAVRYDARRRAFMIEAGAQLMDVYKKLDAGWGVTLPGGTSATVALGGHIAGGGYGALSRALGLATDYLYAVEVAVVDAAGRARAVVATREHTDPRRELWWAHTGGGGGNFGVVTRYWFRSPDAPRHCTDPTLLLPRPPRDILAGMVGFPREGMDRASFRRVIRNHGRWHEQHSGADSPYTGLYSGLVFYGRPESGDPGPAANCYVYMDGTRPDAETLLRAYLHAVADGVGGTPQFSPITRQPWIAAAEYLAGAQDSDVGRHKLKSAYLRRGHNNAQADVLYTYLNSTGNRHELSNVTFHSYGGRINSVAGDATASSHRDSVLKAIYMNTWQDPAADGASVDWLRRLYRDVFAATGGVPVPGRDTDGCYINYSDIDAADPRWNTSGVPWQRLYYKDAYPRLQRVKAAWDPRNVFRHALAVTPERTR
ncbi:BBE domain-containing protein [Streptomyces sp. NY05-11A]|uniref:BBE domain-containing protein n=1 Tax=Streptomyces soliscabiei TaxID=588897 RepID=UPI0029A603C7|nr:BBE domain-containing protein [Streptomyces sp. NY05-11A]MDX2680470.1 BBE domain-containing protein [Streptomyces sp. NY05-11A]